MGFDIGFTGSFLTQMMQKILHLDPNSIESITFIGKKTQNVFMSIIKNNEIFLARLQSIPVFVHDAFSKKALQNEDVTQFVQKILKWAFFEGKNIIFEVKLVYMA